MNKQEWIDRGRSIISEKYWELWDKCVSIRVDDIYGGAELGAALDIIEPLNNGCSFAEAKDILDSQGHSGMSHGMTCSIVKSFCDRGEDFVKMVNA